MIVVVTLCSLYICPLWVPYVYHLPQKCHGHFWLQFPLSFSLDTFYDYNTNAFSVFYTFRFSFPQLNDDFSLL